MILVKYPAVEPGPAGKSLAADIDQVANTKLGNFFRVKGCFQFISSHLYYLPLNQSGLAICSTVPSARIRLEARRATMQLLLMATQMPAIWV